MPTVLASTLMHLRAGGAGVLHMQADKRMWENSHQHAPGALIGAYNPKNAIKPNPVRQNNLISMYLVTRLCQNADATFTTDDNCVMPVITSQQVVCQVTKC